MSILDELGDIADASAFGIKPVGYGRRVTAKIAVSEFCRRGHQRTEENSYRYKRGKHLWVICRECRKINQDARRGKQSPTKG